MQKQADNCAPPLSELLNHGLNTKPHEIALHSRERNLSWLELEESSSALAEGYLAFGLKPGDRIASLMPNRVELLVHYLACFKAGICVTPLNYRYTYREIDHALQVSGASALLVHAERAEDLKQSTMVPKLPLGTIIYAGSEVPAASSFESLLATKTSGRVFVQVDPTSPAAIFFTSGSTGPAKGVTHTHHSIRWMLAYAVIGFELRSDDVFLPGSSLSHIGSFYRSLSSLSCGTKVVVARSYDSHEILALLREYKPTIFSMIPAALLALVRDHDLQPHDFLSLRFCQSAADKVSTELMKEFSAIAGFPIDEGYGMTEVGPATQNPPSGLVKPGSIGPAIGGLEVEIRSNNGELVPIEKVGQLWIKTRSLMASYWGDPAATEEVIRDGWLDTGDLAYADADGYIWFYGRKKQVIVHDGSNITPLEVESALGEHPAVALAGVIGIHDELHGERVRAYVTLRNDQPKPSAGDLIVFCRERIGYKAPEEIIFLDAIPLNPSGKIDRVSLKKMAEDHLNPHLDEQPPH
jgi:acyl-coenzyme A synthetase/AMP-(fatty) acid ligase